MYLAVIFLQQIEVLCVNDACDLCETGFCPSFLFKPVGLVFIVFQIFIGSLDEKFKYQSFLFALWLNISLHYWRPKVDKVILNVYYNSISWFFLHEKSKSQRFITFCFIEKVRKGALQNLLIFCLDDIKCLSLIWAISILPNIVNGI